MKRKFTLLLAAAILAATPAVSSFASGMDEALIVEEAGDSGTEADETAPYDESSVSLQSDATDDSGITDESGVIEESGANNESSEISEEQLMILSIEEASEVPEAILEGETAVETVLAEDIATEDTAAGIADITEIRVSTVEELIAAIASNTKIILADGVYICDGLSIQEVSNLTIAAEHSGCAEILSTDETGSVVGIAYSEDLNIIGIIMGHTTETYCNAPVLSAAFCSDITVTGCDLYGCGEIGVQVTYSTGFLAENCVIRDCSSYIVGFFNTEGAFKKCIMSGNGCNSNAAIHLGKNSNATFTGCTFINNKNGTLTDDANFATFTNCVFENNAWDGASASAYGVCLNGIAWRVANQILYLGEAIACDGGAVLSSNSGEVLPYSKYSVPWKDYSITKVSLADGVTYPASPYPTAVITEAKDISECKVVFAQSTYTYAGERISPVFTVQDGSSTLTAGTDYTYGISDTNMPGTPEVYIYGKGNYTGTLTATFTINFAVGKISSLTNTTSGVKVKWNSIAGATGHYVYRKSASGSYKQIATISSASTLSYTDTAVKSKNGKTYTYKIVAYRGAQGAIVGTGTGKTIVRLTGTTLTSVTNSAAGKAKVKWTAVSKVTGYQIQYSTSKTFASNNTKKKSLRCVEGQPESDKAHERHHLLCANSDIQDSQRHDLLQCMEQQAEGKNQQVTVTFI